MCIRDRKKVTPEPILDFGRPAVEHLSQAIAFPTISSEMNQPVDTAVFRAFHRFLAVTYPKVHATLKKETFSEFSLLYTWEGRNKTLKPIILMAHLDVVPAGDPDLWKHAPFSGDINGTQVWGRGAMDDKASMISILEAVERLLSEKIRPERTLYLAFGHDEEIGGTRGAQVMASELEKRGVLAEYILDEGMAITRGMVPMVRKPVALIGTSEKGQMSVRLSVEMPGGHSSTPEKKTAISVLNKALGNVFTHPAKPHIAGSVKDFISYMAPEMPYYAKVLFANLWLFRHIVTGIYQITGSGNALVRTTVAPTILRAGTKANVLPTRAEAILNYRILPGEKSSEVL
jgi:carboxypeptidase PM20D1